jgi:hypothetical protein
MMLMCFGASMPTRTTGPPVPCWRVTLVTVTLMSGPTTTLSPGFNATISIVNPFDCLDVLE